jgi:type 2 lantibiotic biosynthesis protein LanM
MQEEYLVTEIACLASNLYERIDIVKELRSTSSLTKLPLELPAYEQWVLRKFIGKLDAMKLKQQIYQDSSHIPNSEELYRILAEYRICELNLESLTDNDWAYIRNRHASWLPIYRAGLETLELKDKSFQDSFWLEPLIYYQRHGVVCEPFFRLIELELKKTCDLLKQTDDTFIIDREVFTSVQLELLNRFEIAITSALEADISIYCYNNGILKSTDSEAFSSYVEATFNNQNSYHRFYCKFPTLGRWLAQVTGFIITNTKQLLQRLQIDREELSEQFFDKMPVYKLQSLSIGESDYHVGGKSVAFLKLELADRNTSEPNYKTLVYKPRCIKSEYATQEILKTLSENTEINFPNYQLLCKDGYGYVEFLEVGNQAVTETEVKTFYKQLGGYLALFYILGGSDLHYQNLITSNCQANICDCETVLEILPEETENYTDTPFDSIFKTNLIDWPRADGDDTFIRTSGSMGGESFLSPLPSPQIAKAGTLAVGVERKEGVFVKGSTGNRLFYQDALVDPAVYWQDIVFGFNAVYDWIQSYTEKFIVVIEQVFTGAFIRFVNRPTQVYAKILDSARHAKCLAKPLETDLVFQCLVEYPRRWDEGGELAHLEYWTLWDLDIPLFSVQAGKDELLNGYHQPTGIPLLSSAIKNAVTRMRRLGLDNRNRQTQYIKATFLGNGGSDEAFTDTALEYACQCGLQLYASMVTEPGCAPWRTYDFSMRGKDLVDVNACLYNGSAGITLFFAYLNALRPDERFRMAAQLGLEHVLSCTDRNSISAFTGLSGTIYLLTHLASLWERPDLLEDVRRLCSELRLLICEDPYYDILHGAAGVIPVLLSLTKQESVSPQLKAEALQCLHECAHQILKSAVAKNGTLSWPASTDVAAANLTGFAHGAAGIGWSLILLGQNTGHTEYVDAGLKAFAYESLHFDQEQLNWQDFRLSVLVDQTSKPRFSYFWCNGSSGIGLSRVSTWSLLGQNNEALLKDVQYSIGATLRYLPKLENDSLCHGRAGISDFLLTCSKLLNEPYLRMEANSQALLQWSSFEKYRRWQCVIDSSCVLPDLMTGIAGVGMHFLRLAHPDFIPSPLLLEPPPPQDSSLRS